MKTTQIRAEEERSDRQDASESSPAGAHHATSDIVMFDARSSAKNSRPGDEK